MEDNWGILVSVNLYKAFDTLERSFIKKAFEYFNFPECLVKWISMTYNNNDDQIISNGCMSEGLIVTRRVRQGCPLFICKVFIEIDLYALAIRHNQNQGITQIEVEKINHFADDSFNNRAEDDNLVEAVKATDHCKQTLGLGMNKNKAV